MSHITDSEMFIFAAIISQIEHDVRGDSRKDYWLTIQPFFMV
jgi:hypothetical protein